MTIIVRRTLYCEVVGCEMQLESLSKSSEHLREDARKDGWKFRKGRDLCPQCAKDETAKEPQT